jgi:hypothetical protein
MTANDAGKDGNTDAGQQTAGILTKDLRHRGIGKHFAEALFLLKKGNVFPGYGAVKVCFLRDEQNWSESPSFSPLTYYGKNYGKKI